MSIYKRGHVDPVRECPERVAELHRKYAVRPPETSLEGEGALRLVQRTELDQMGHTPSGTGRKQQGYGFDPLTEGVSRTVTVRNYDENNIEVSYGSVRANYDRPEKDDSQRSAPNLLTQRQNHMRSIRRSKAQVRRKCMAGGLDHMLTLTFQENIEDVRLAYVLFARFIRLVRKRHPAWAYCAVHELQKRGAVHFHLAVRGFQDVRFLRSTWLKVVGNGNIDVQGPRGQGSKKWGLPLLAGYLSKYIMKNATASNGRQRYRVSEGIEIPKDTFIYTLKRGRSLVQEIMDSFGVNIAHHWEDENHPNGWACSWET